ncbi:hypothetical protein QTP88_014764 [Uroleucon formosanum]
MSGQLELPFVYSLKASSNPNIFTPAAHSQKIQLESSITYSWSILWATRHLLLNYLQSIINILRTTLLSSSSVLSINESRQSELDNDILSAFVYLTKSLQSRYYYIIMYINIQGSVKIAGWLKQTSKPANKNSAAAMNKRTRFDRGHTESHNYRLR